MLRHVAVALGLLVSSSAFAQVIYLPVQSQYHTPSGETYYYGGADLRVHAMARHHGCPSYGYANNLHRFDGGNSFGQPSPMYNRDAVYSDCAAFGQDVSRLGYSAIDAQNEANANAARYFRKADLLNNAIVLPDGSRIVPPTPPMFVPMQSNYVATSPMLMNPARRGQVIIIPKKLLNRPLKEFTEPKPPQKVAVSE